MSAGSDLILDTALKAAEHDRFDHKAIAGVVADLALNATPPVNIALFGPWGSGKSSFFGLLDERLGKAGRPVKVATYDAWKYGGRALKKHFVGSVAEQLGLGGEDFEDRLAHDQETLRLDLWAWVKENRKSLFVGAGLALALAVVWFFLVSLIIWAVNWDAGFGKATQAAVATVGTVLSLGFAALLFGPKVLESAVVKVKEAAPETDDEFAKSFQRLVAKAINVEKGERLIVFIDELDRCSPTDVVATLIDLKTFLDVNGCIFVVAADREVLERSLREVPQANPVRDEDPYYSTPGAFLDKIFQHQIPLPPLRPQALTRFARELVESQGGLWADLRAAQEDERLFLRVVYGLVPVHVRSPRRVKVLLNNYATNVRIAQARGVDWLQRAEEIATLTVLETEFPSVVADLVRFPSLLKYLRHTDVTPPSKNARATVTSYLRVLGDSPEAQGPEDDETPVAGDLLVDPELDKASGRRANKTLVENLLAYLRKIEASGIDDPRPDLLFLQSAGAQEGIDDPDLAEVIDFAADFSADDVVAKFADQPSSVVATAVRLLSQQSEAERGPGRLSITESVCRLTEQLDPVDAQAVAPVVAGTVLAEANNPDWPTEATPGALILGVIGASKPLVQTLLTQQDANDMAQSGVLGRIASVLTYANDQQADLIHGLLSSAYYMHPEPLHDALSSTPPAVAHALWQSTMSTVGDALKTMSAPTVAAPAATTRAASAAATAEPEPRPDDTVAERFEALLTAVEGRTDDQSEALISAVLKFGQENKIDEVRSAASERAEATLERINDPAALNEHAMLGLQHSPLDEATWWAERLTESEPAPDAYIVFERLVQPLATASDSDLERIAPAIPAVIKHIPEDELGDAERWIGVTLRQTAWSTAETSTAKNRANLYATAESLRPLLNEADAAELDAVLAKDLVTGLGAGSDDTRAADILDLARKVPASVAIEIEKQTLAREDAEDERVLTLRLRIAASRQGSGTMPASADVLAVAGQDDAKEAFAEWLGLNPPLHEAQRVLGSITVYTHALDKYAAALDIAERTDLWVDIAGRSGNWGPGSFRAIGKHGVSSAAVEQVATAVAEATQQGQRDALIDRLGSARLIEQPQHKAATDLVLQLLATGIGGDVALAARVAHQTGGAAYGKVVQVREAFDAALQSKPKSLTGTQKDRLRAINLLSKPPKKRSKGLRGLLGG